MDLKRLERVWDSLGRRDPYWAVLTHAGKSRGRWSEAEFFRTGEDDIARLFATAAARGWPIGTRRALDFGCGAGRLAQALAARFEHVDGVDISASMLEVARARNRFGARCEYHHNTGPSLDRFVTGAFDFVGSFLTLQHIPPAFARRYLAELVRVLAPGGLLVLQAPSHRGPIEPDTGEGTAHTMATRKLPRSACQARVTLDRQDLTTGAGQRLLLGVTVRNQSDSVWPSGGRDDGRYQIQVGNRWRLAGGEVVVANDGRTPLPHDLEPGRDVHLFLEITAPEYSGDYRLDVDVVQEHVAWFSAYGSQATTAAARVDGGPARPPARARRGFRARFPRLHRAAVALGLDAVRGSIRLVRASIRRKAERDQTGRWHRDAMMMYCLPRRSVTDLVAQAGGQLLHVDQELVPAGFQDCCYWVTKS
jgi:SAM-dependent methyltransferase